MKKDGFNYRFDQMNYGIIPIVSIKSENFESFVQGIFDVLWLRTDEKFKNLLEIKIGNDILTQFDYIV